MSNTRAVSKLKTAVPYILTVVILAAFFVYLGQNANRYRQLLNVSPALLGGMFGVSLLLVSSNGLINYLLYRGLGVSISLNEGVGLAAVNTLANQLPFAGGMVAKGVYLKRRHHLAYKHFLSATLALYVCFVAGNGLVGLVLLGYWQLTSQTTIPALLFMGFLGMASAIVLLALPLDSGMVPAKWRQRLLQLMQGWHILASNRRLIAQLVGVQLLMTLLIAVRLWLAFHLLSQDVTLAQCVLFAAATILTRLVSITPGGLGVREAIVVGVASVLGFEPGISAVAAGIDRLVATLVVIVLGSIYSYILSRNVLNGSPTLTPDVDLPQK